MQPLRAFVWRLADLLAPPPPRGGLYVEMEEEDVNAPSFEPVPAAVYETQEDADRAFLQCYLRYMEHHLGRTPMYRTDLFCAMFPVEKEQPNGSPPKRYWWMFYNHPMAVLMDETVEREIAYDEVSYGEVAVYRDEDVCACVDKLMEAYAVHLEMHLLQVRSGYERDQDKVEHVTIVIQGQEDKKEK